MDSTCGKNKRKRAVKLSFEYLKEFKRWKEGKDLDTRFFFPVMLVRPEEDNYNELVGKSQEHSKDYDGLFIYGLEGTPVEKYNRINAYLTRLELQENQVVGLSSDGSILDVMAGVLAGVNVFEQSYPFDISQLGHSLDLTLNYSSQDAKPYTLEALLDLLSQVKSLKTNDLNSKDFVKSHTTIETNSTSYTYSYIHHMLSVKEMNATILLT
jgi:queuine/archaeosine tRNA-ribosyltransferase